MMYSNFEIWNLTNLNKIVSTRIRNLGLGLFASPVIAVGIHRKQNVGFVLLDIGFGGIANFNSSAVIARNRFSNANLGLVLFAPGVLVLATKPNMALVVLAPGFIANFHSSSSRNNVDNEFDLVNMLDNIQKDVNKKSNSSLVRSEMEMEKEKVSERNLALDWGGGYAWGKMDNDKWAKLAELTREREKVKMIQKLEDQQKLALERIEKDKLNKTKLAKAKIEEEILIKDFNRQLQVIKNMNIIKNVIVNIKDIEKVMNLKVISSAYKDLTLHDIDTIIEAEKHQLELFGPGNELARFNANQNFKNIAKNWFEENLISNKSDLYQRILLTIMDVISMDNINSYDKEIVIEQLCYFANYRYVEDIDSSKNLSSKTIKYLKNKHADLSQWIEFLKIQLNKDNYTVNKFQKAPEFGQDLVQSDKDVKDSIAVARFVIDTLGVKRVASLLLNLLFMHYSKVQSKDKSFTLYTNSVTKFGRMLFKTSMQTLHKNKHDKITFTEV